MLDERMKINMCLSTTLFQLLHVFLRAELISIPGTSALGLMEFHAFAMGRELPEY